MIRKILFIVMVLFTVSCNKDFLDINTDPNNPTAIEVSKLLPWAQRTLGDALALGEDNGGLSQILSVYTHQVSTREEPDQYGATGNEFYLVWHGQNYMLLHRPPVQQLLYLAY